MTHPVARLAPLSSLAVAFIFFLLALGAGSNASAHPDLVSEVIDQRQIDRLRSASEKEMGGRFLIRGTRFFGSPVHEEMTIRSLQLSDVLGATFDPEKYAHFVRGVFWNDDPTQALWPDDDSALADTFGIAWSAQFLAAKSCATKGCNGAPPKFYANGDNLLGRSHFGDLQFLHAMANQDGEEASTIRSRVLMWVEFAYKVASGELQPSTRIRQVPVDGIPQLFDKPPSFSNASISKFFGTARVRELAAGTILHVIQDSFADGHVERVIKHGTTSRPYAKESIVRFHSYVNQDGDLHAAADTFPPQLSLMLGRDRDAHDPINHGAAVLQMLFRPKPVPWSEARKYFEVRVFPTAVNAQRSSPGEAFSKRAARDDGLSGHEGRKRALLVGIDRYASASVTKLSGAVNDVLAMKATLQSRFGFRAADIIVLTDEQATRSAILGQFRSHLIEGSGPNDTLLFHFSGHGSQAITTDTSDESDRLDETLVPYDGRTAGVFDIADNEIGELVDAASEKVKHLAMFIDACHSGSAARDAYLGQPRRIDPDSRRRPSGQVPVTGTKSASRAVLSGPQQDARLVLVSASRSNERAYEYTTAAGHTYGALTYFLTQELLETKRPLTYRSLIDVVGDRVTRANQAQHPQLEGGLRENHVFAQSAAPSEPFLHAEASIDGSLVVIRGGAAQDVTVGSEFALYLPTTVTFGADAKPLARAKVVEVDAFSARATVIEGRPTAGLLKANLVKQSFGSEKVRVGLVGQQTPLLSAIRERLRARAWKSSRWEQPIDLTQVFDLTSSGLPQVLLREADGSLRIEDPSGLPHASLATSDSEQTAQAAVERLLLLARWRRTLDLRSPLSTLQVDVKLIPDQAADRLDITPTTLVATPGQRFRVQVTNHPANGRNLYFRILNLYFDGRVEPIFPSSGQNPFIPPDGKPVTLGAVFTASPYDSKGSNVEFLKFFFADRELDLDFFRQDVPRAIGMCARSGLPVTGLLCELDLTGQASRVAVTPVEDWFTRLQRIEVRPGP